MQIHNVPTMLFLWSISIPKGLFKHIQSEDVAHVRTCHYIIILDT